MKTIYLNQSEAVLYFKAYDLQYYYAWRSDYEIADKMYELAFGSEGYIYQKKSMILAFLGYHSKI